MIHFAGNDTYKVSIGHAYIYKDGRRLSPDRGPGIDRRRGRYRLSSGGPVLIAQNSINKYRRKRARQAMHDNMIYNKYSPGAYS